MSDTKQLNLNRSQSMLHLINANVAYCLWPRGSGKTSGGIGPRLQHLSNVMPRSKCILYTDTFERNYDVVVPGIMDFLINEMGMREDEDFVKYKAPDKQWPKPLTPIDKYDKIISFRSGFALCLASAKVAGSANGHNAQAAIVDETKFVPQAKITNELLRALRGARRQFGHLPEYRSHWCFTDKWQGEVKWMQEKGKETKPEVIRAVLTLAIKVQDLHAKLRATTRNEDVAAIKKQILEIETKLLPVRRNLVYLSEAKAFENIEVLGEKWYRDQKRDCASIMEYNVAILNKDPDWAINTFYPFLSEQQHYYRAINNIDVDIHQGFSVALDYNWRITPMPVAQYGKKPGDTIDGIKVVNAFHTLHPDGGIEKTIQAFCDYYATHPKKIVNYVYNHTAVGKRPDGASFHEIAIKTFRANGWHVHEVRIKALEHNIKFEKFKLWMQSTTDLPLSINQLTCGDSLCKSMQLANAITSGGVTKKNKSMEKKDHVNPVEQTDYSDAFDDLYWAMKNERPRMLTDKSTGLAGIVLR